MSQSAATASNALYLSFLQAIEDEGFEGEMSPDKATRLSLATDNIAASIA